MSQVRVNASAIPQEKTDATQARGCEIAFLEPRIGKLIDGVLLKRGRKTGAKRPPL